MGIETLAIASLGTSVLGGATAAVGSVMSGQAAQAATNYRAQVARNMAEHALAVGRVEAQKQGFKTASIIGQQRAQQSASGVEVDVGSPVDVRASAAQMGALDTETILNNAAQKAWGLRSQATLDEFSGEAAATEGWLKGLSSAMSTASGVGDKWLKYRTSGVPGPWG